MNGWHLIGFVAAFVLGWVMRRRQVTHLLRENTELRHRIWNRQWAGDMRDVVNRRPSVRRPA